MSATAAEKLAEPIFNDSTRRDIQRVFEKQRAFSRSLRKTTAKERIAKIKRLRDAVLARREEIYEACHNDFRKPEAETDIGELMAVVSEANHAIRSLKGWMKPVRVMPTKTMLGTRSYIRYEPLGVNLIIAPWNYPINLCFAPLISALAAGNTAIVKPSEMTPHTSAWMKKLLDELFDEQEVAVFEGGVDATTYLLELPFDHIFFTGSPQVGKIVMAAAAKNLTKVTLELGGKSPTIVHKDANIKNTAKSIVFSKYANNGQTCIAPDYIYVHQDVEQAFLSELRQCVNKAYGADTAAQVSSPDYCRIVNERHYSRVKGLLDDALTDGAEVVAGGGSQGEGENFVAPTVLTKLNPESRIMREEIFGPLLPVISYADEAEVIDYINDNPKPLALYVYTGSQKFAQKVIEETSSGDACINTSLVQYLHGNLPFGGVNNSGIGKAHGVYGYRAFSHERSVVQDKFAATLLMAPPYTNFVKRLIKATIRFLS